MPFKTTHLSKMDNECLLAIQGFVDSLDQASYVDRKFKEHKMRGQYADTWSLVLAPSWDEAKGSLGVLEILRG